MSNLSRVVLSWAPARRLAANPGRQRHPGYSEVLLRCRRCLTTVTCSVNFMGTSGDNPLTAWLYR